MPNHPVDCRGHRPATDRKGHGALPGYIKSRIGLIKDKLKARTIDDVVALAEEYGYYKVGSRRPATVARNAIGLPAKRILDISLTPREYEVLWSVANRDAKSSVLADRLDITIGTLYHHYTGIKREFGAKTFNDAASRARDLGLLPKRAKATPTARFGLTERQRAMLQHIAAGRSRDEIARMSGCSLKTLQTYSVSIQYRLNVTSLNDAVAIATARGLL